MASTKAKISYDGSKAWLIFWAIVFFPVALLLLATCGKFAISGKEYWVRYSGSLFWLGFWTIFCFPISIFLLVANGLEVVETDLAIAQSGGVTT